MDVKIEAGKGGGSTRPGDTTAFRTVWVAVACMTFPTLVFVSGLYKPALAFIGGVGSGTSQKRAGQGLVGGGDAFAADAPRDRYLGGLLAAGFDEESCRSRYQSTAYRKPSPHKPSPYLVGRLRDYEEHHRRCAPYTGGFNRTLKYLKAEEASPAEEMECRYVLWTPWSGLGNRILTLASTFLYALLTDRVVLIDRGKDMTSLFCEPFPHTTWLLPEDFPISDYDVYNRTHPLSYGNLLKKNEVTTDGSSRPPPSFVYVNLPHDYGTDDMHFYCEPDQAILRKVPWLFIRSNLYFVPAFFLNRDFEPELSRMFPEKETVFHHLSRYLFHPTNDVWGMVTRYYRSYLAPAKERLGIQIRIFNHKASPFDVVFRQIVNCTQGEGLLPEVVDMNCSGSYPARPADPRKTKSVVVTSLYSGYFDKIKGMYWEHAAADGTAVTVSQPTHEEQQQTDRRDHDVKAWTEMNLLSLTDVLVTSARSTFGYTGQGLGGIRPWVLSKRTKAEMPRPSCVRDISMEPCLLSPPWYVCREKKNGDNGRVVPFVTHCSDERIGLKLVDRSSR